MVFPGGTTTPSTLAIGRCKHDGGPSRWGLRYLRRTINVQLLLLKSYSPGPWASQIHWAEFRSARRVPDHAILGVFPLCPNKSRSPTALSEQTFYCDSTYTSFRCRSIPEYLHFGRWAISVSLLTESFCGLILPPEWEEDTRNQSTRAIPLHLLLKRPLLFVSRP